MLTRHTIIGPLLTLVPATDEHVAALEIGMTPPGLVLAAGFPHEDTRPRSRSGTALAEPERGRGYGSEADLPGGLRLRRTR